jgi:hypothetical protein
MENDKAGLELCNYIRNDTGNKLTQIFIRTGQPGLAPERDIVDKYDINGYFTKVEATEDKLYSLIKSAVRQYLSSGTALATVELLNNQMAAGGARQKVLYAVSSVGGLVRLYQSSGPNSVAPYWSGVASFRTWFSPRRA